MEERGEYLGSRLEVRRFLLSRLEVRRFLLAYDTTPVLHSLHHIFVVLVPWMEHQTKRGEDVNQANLKDNSEGRHPVLGIVFIFPHTLVCVPRAPPALVEDARNQRATKQGARKNS
jgi:hypothetical protein